MSFRHGFRAGSMRGGKGPALASSASDAVGITANNGVRQLVTFHLDGEEFAMDILKVQEIIRMMDITRVPNAPDFVEGVINLRGKIVPVIGLRKRFGLPHTEYDQLNRIVVVEVGNAVTGLVVDSVSEVLRIPTDIVEPPPKMVKVERDYISGVGKLKDRLLMLLDVDRLMNDAEQSACSEVSPAEVNTTSATGAAA